jgi:glycosyltransferase 2 family protein
MLMPATPSTDFAVVAVVFVSATLLGFISHAPGSLGIFDATTLLALPQFQTEELLASLLIFRFLYFVAPFAVAVLMLGARELCLARRARIQSRSAECSAGVDTQVDGAPEVAQGPRGSLIRCG